jgi:UDP-N-acetylmuramoylalanine--D-glutamate ligase
LDYTPQLLTQSLNTRPRCSKSSNISKLAQAGDSIATITAIKALINQYENIVLIAGGIKNQEDYNALFALIDNHISHVVLIGQSAKELGNNIHTTKLSYANSMKAAVNIANILIDKGAILLSPACASFDMFDDLKRCSLLDF